MTLQSADKLDGNVARPSSRGRVSGHELTLQAAVNLVRPRDVVLCGFATGQPVGLLEALGARPDLEEVVLYTGIMIRPYAFIQNPAVRIVSGFFGPIERAARALGRPIE